MHAKKLTGTRVLFEELTYGQSDRLSLVATGQLIRGVFNESHDLRTIDGDNIRHSTGPDQAIMYVMI